MNLPYAWRCFVCSDVNGPTAAVCAACGFPACATGADIAAAMAARATEAKGRCPAVRAASDLDSIVDALAPLPLWRRFIAVGGALVSAGAVLWLKVTFSLAGVMGGLAGLLAGLALMVLAIAGVESSTSNSRRSVAT